MDAGFSSPRNDAFPAGLRVLVVDDDPTWLKILEKMLKKCLYEVTTCGLAREALKLLRERKDGYDIVISDVNMPDMDGFKLLEHVGLEMDLPVIMMSVDGETSRVMKGVQHGACDYLLKPIRMKELRNIWQHVFRKRIHEVRDIESQEGFEGIQMTRNGSDQYDDGPITIGEDLNSVKKRKDNESRHDDRDSGDPSSAKKVRVVWSVELHQKFVKAVNQYGFDKVGPKKILDLMNVPWLTRENVASHLQKYRLYLSRLQKDNDLRTFGAIKHSDSPSKDADGSFVPQNSINMQQNDVTNGNCIFSGNILAQNVDPKSREGDLKGIVSMPKAEPKRTSSVDVSDVQKTRSSKPGFNHSFASLDSEVNYSAFDSSITQFSWSEVPEIRFKQGHKPSQLESGFSHLPLLLGSQHQIQVDELQPAPSISSGLFMTNRDIAGPIESRPLYAKFINNHVSQANPKGSSIDSFPVQSKSHSVNHQGLDTISRMKNQGFNLSCITDLESTQQSLNPEFGSAFTSMDKNMQLCWFPADNYTMNLGLQNIDWSEYNDPGPFAEAPIHLYDALRFDYGYPCDPAEYSIIDQALFIA